MRDNNLYVKYFDPSLDENGLADLLKVSPVAAAL